jgi:single stranded DNA-binding protein
MNAVSLIGRLTADPQLRTTSRGQSVTTMRLAIPRTRTDAAKPSAAFVDVEAWQALALACCEHLHSGRQVVVEGRLEHRVADHRRGAPPARARHRAQHRLPRRARWPEPVRSRQRRGGGVRRATLLAWTA